MPSKRTNRAYTLMEVILVIGLLVVLMAMVLPNVYGELVRSRLPTSAEQMRALLQLTRANAMLDGRRYRIRFVREDEIDAVGTQVQPLIEVEGDPLHEPEKFRPVLAAWATDRTFERGIRCAQVILEKPTVDRLLGDADEGLYEEEMEELEEDLGEAFDEGFPPLMFEPDGTSSWATFLLTDAPPEVEYQDLDPEDHEFEQIEVILDGLIGLCWLQRPLYEEELEMMRDHGWPPVLRKDFLTPVALTEDNVLEIRESRNFR